MKSKVKPFKKVKNKKPRKRELVLDVLKDEASSEASSKARHPASRAK